MKIGLVAIAKNEGKFILEWLSHHLALGIDEITVYDNNSTDDMPVLLDKVSKKFPVTRIFWKGPAIDSPQTTAYNNFLHRHAEGFDWVCFFDLDEFLVINKKGESLRTILGGYGPDVGAVAVNWLTFGSSGKLTKDYGLVRNTFRYGAPRHWGNNRHVKTIVRPKNVRKMGIHDCLLHTGRYILPNGQDLVMTRKRGISDEIDHSILQLNHYQIKSKEDYLEKIARGRAGRRLDDPERFRSNPEDFFKKLNRNDVLYESIDFNIEEFSRIHQKMLAVVQDP